MVSAHFSSSNLRASVFSVVNVRFLDPRMNANSRRDLTRSDGFHFREIPCISVVNLFSHPFRRDNTSRIAAASSDVTMGFITKASKE